MALTYSADLAEALEAQKKSLIANAKPDDNQKVKSGHAEKKSGHTRPRAPEISLDQPGRLRVAHLLALLGVSHATLYAGLKTGRYPKPTGYDLKLPYWSTSVIKAFLNA